MQQVTTTLEATASALAVLEKSDKEFRSRNEVLEAANAALNTEVVELRPVRRALRSPSSCDCIRGCMTMSFAV